MIIWFCHSNMHFDLCCGVTSCHSCGLRLGNCTIVQSYNLSQSRTRFSLSQLCPDLPKSLLYWSIDPLSATALLCSSRTISPKVLRDLVRNSVSKAHYIIQRRMRFCKPWVYKVVWYLAYFSMLNLALNLSCGVTS